MPDSDNRRESFRLDDIVLLRLRTPDAETIARTLDDFNAFRIRYCLKSHLQNQQDVRQPKLKLIRKRDPEIAQYLEHLENQIVQLADRLAQDSNLEPDVVASETPVNLSATGIRFRTTQKMDVGQQVELGILLSTSATQVVMVAQVVRHEKQPEGDYSVSLFYSRIHPEDKEAIIRHLAKLQQLELQARRAG